MRPTVGEFDVGTETIRRDQPIISRVAVNLKDASGVSFTTVKKVNVPKTIKKKNGKGKRK